jgi:ribosome-associated protein
VTGALSTGENDQVPAPRDVTIRDETIRLGQFLKLADLIDTGSEARPLLMQGLVSVNGETETRRGRQLVRGDVVSLGDSAVRVS